MTSAVEPAEVKLLHPIDYVREDKASGHIVYHIWSHSWDNSHYYLEEWKPDTTVNFDCCSGCIASGPSNPTHHLESMNYCTGDKCYYLSGRAPQINMCTNKPFEDSWQITPEINGINGTPTPVTKFFRRRP